MCWTSCIAFISKKIIRFTSVFSLSPLQTVVFVLIYSYSFGCITGHFWPTNFFLYTQIYIYLWIMCNRPIWCSLPPPYCARHPFLLNQLIPLGRGRVLTRAASAHRCRNHIWWSSTFFIQYTIHIFFSRGRKFSAIAFWNIVWRWYNSVHGLHSGWRIQMNWKTL